MVHVSVVIYAKPDYAWTFKTILRLIRIDTAKVVLSHFWKGQL